MTRPISYKIQSHCEDCLYSDYIFDRQNMIMVWSCKKHACRVDCYGICNDYQYERDIYEQE